MKFINIGVGILILSMLSVLQINAQSRPQKIEQLIVELREEAEKEHEEAIRIARINGWPQEGLVRINEEGRPIYLKNNNLTSALLTGTAVVSDVFSVTGKDLKLGLWEAGGIPFLGSLDLAGRVSIMDGTPTNSYTQHATHVAGTLIGNPLPGFPLDTRGMAYEATIDAYDVTFSDDNAEMLAAAATSIHSVAEGRLLISNHSYGIGAGWEWNSTTQAYDWYGAPNQYFSGGSDSSFGFYDTKATAWDNISYNAPYYLIVKSAGNDNSNNPVNGVSNVRNGWGGTGTTSYVPYNSAIHPQGDGFYSNGFNTLPTTSVAKNILTIGAVDKTFSIANFSSRGPTNDGRIKPDLCGIGVDVLSADTTVVGSVSLSGTSMAAPNVAGSLLLLQELYRDRYKVAGDSLFMKSATLKALAIHSALDFGNPGPDYTHGWGVLNMAQAAAYIDQDAWTEGSTTVNIIEDTIHSADVSDVYEYAFRAKGTEEIKVTLVYTDPVKNVSGTQPQLANDLDLFVFRPSVFQGWEPYVLDPNNPSNNATTGDNDLDNVEQVKITSPVNDLYYINVSVEGTLQDGEPQAFSLIISGLDEVCQANIQHKIMYLDTGFYLADFNIQSQATIQAGKEVIYSCGGKVILKPGFRAKVQNSTGTGYFRTAHGSCN